MKKIFTLLAVAAMAVTMHAQEKEWNISNWETAVYTSDVTIDGFTIYATTNGKVEVDDNKKTVDGVQYTKRLKTGGAGSNSGGTMSRVLSFDVPGPGTISFIAASSNSKDNRVVGVAFGEFIAFPSAADAVLPDGLTALDVVIGNPQVKSVSYTGEATKVYIYSKSGGVNFLDFKFVPQGTSGIDDIDVDNASAPVEYFNLQGIRVENPTNGLYIRRQGNKVTKVVL